MPSRVLGFIPRVGVSRASGIFVALIVICTMLSIAAPKFLTSYNIGIVIRQASFVAIVAMGLHLLDNLEPAPADRAVPRFLHQGLQMRRGLVIRRGSIADCLLEKRPQQSTSKGLRKDPDGWNCQRQARLLLPDHVRKVRLAKVILDFLAAPQLKRLGQVEADIFGLPALLLYPLLHHRFVADDPPKSLVDRAARAAADLTVGTVIVFVHVALASRDTARRPPRLPQVGRRAELRE